MMAERMARLTALALDWEPSYEVVWEVQLARLAAYNEGGARRLQYFAHGWADNPPLTVWVNKQRTFKKKLDRGEAKPRITAAHRRRRSWRHCALCGIRSEAGRVAR
jgi:hypothetical protein